MVRLERTCVICRTKKPKNELFRFVVKDNKAVFDQKQSSAGRGFYICGKKCWENAVKKNRKIRVGSDAKKAINISLSEKTFEDIVKS